MKLERWFPSRLAGALVLTGALAVPGLCRGAMPHEGGASSGSALAPGCRYYGIDTDNDKLVRIDTATGALTEVGPLGIDAATAGADFDANGRLWAFSADGTNPNQAFVYTVDLATGAAQVRHVLDVSVGGGGVGLEFGPDGQLYWIAGGNRELRRIDLQTGVVTKVLDLAFSSVALAMRDGDAAFFTIDAERAFLIRLDPVTGATTDVGPTAPGIVSLAISNAGELFGLDGDTLYRIDVATGNAVAVGPAPGVPGSAIGCHKPPVARDDVYHAECGARVVVGAPGVLDNDGDPEGAPLVATLVDAPENGGTVALAADGSFTYTPPPGVCSNSFTYAAGDGELGSNVATVHIVPPADCQELYGISTAGNELVRIDPFTGAESPVGDGLGIRVATAGVDFDSQGALWAFSQNADDASEALLYTVDLVSGRATVRHRIDISELGGGVGLEFGPDGLLYRVAGGGRQLQRIDTVTGEVTKVADLPFTSVSLTLPDRCTEFFSADDAGVLMRIDPVDGSVSTVGPTVAGLASLAAAPDGTLYGIGNGTLYRIDSATGAATEVGPAPGVPGAAFRKPFGRSLCIDAGLRSVGGRPLSRYVVTVNDKVRHLNDCPGEREVCEICHPNRPECGTCGAPGFYRLPQGAELTLATPAVPVVGTYAMRFQLRGPFGADNAKLRVTVGEGDLRQVFEVAPDNTSWDLADENLVTLGAGTNRITVRSIGARTVDVERVALERKCPGLCEGPKVNQCLDPKFDAGTRLSRFVTAVSGDAGHANDGGCCGADGNYWVRGMDGRIEAQLDVPAAGRYLVRVFYRVKAAGAEAALRVGVVGGDSRLYGNADLVHGNHFQWSLPFEVSLAAGPQKLELLSQLGDRIDVERISIQLACECGGGAQP
jgi:streptogramin lyase